MYDGVRDFLQNVHYHAPTGIHTKQNFSFIPPVPVTNGPKTIICPQQNKKNKNKKIRSLYFVLNNVYTRVF